MEPLSLADMCFESILKNIGSYGKQLRRKLAPPAREMVLDELTENGGGYTWFEDGFAKVWADLPFLLNSRTKEFRSLWVMDMYQYLDPSRPLQPILRQMLVHLSEQAPNLEYLKLDFPMQDAPIHLDKRELFVITRMENLTKIVFHDVTVKLADLRSLTIECKNLQEVIALEIKVDEKPTFAFEKFPVQIIRVSDWQEKRVGIELRNVSSDGEFSKGYRRLDLGVLEEISQLGFMEKLTNLTQIQIDCYDLEDDDMLEEFPYSLPNLDSAKIYDSRGNVLRKFLEKNGVKLDRLHLACYRERYLSYAQIFDWCPNLKHLKLTGFWALLYGNEIRINRLEQLQHIEIEDGYDFEYEDAGQPVFQLLSILSAPNLKVVKIFVGKIDLGDYWSFIARIINREIFKKLEFLCLCDRDCFAYYNANESDGFTPRGSLVELEDAIKLSRSTY